MSFEPTINILDVPLNVTDKEFDVNTDGDVSVHDDGLYVNIDETEFRISGKNQMVRAKSYWSKLRIRRRQKINYRYWKGSQIDTSAIRDDLEKGVDNIIFRNIETLIPIANSRTPELSGIPAYKNEETRSFASDTIRALRAEWEVKQNMQPLLGRGIRNHQMNFMAVFQYGRDEETGKFWTEEIVAHDLVISKNGDMIARYIKDKTIGDLIEMFPKKRKEILGSIGYPSSLEVSKKIADSPAEYIELWKDDVVGWILGDITLGLSKNPHFDYTGRELEVPDPDGKPGPVELDEQGQPQQKPATTKKTVKYNYFDAPKKPFIFITYWNRGIHVYDDTSLIEQAIGPQDWVNKRKRQIGANADSANGHWISSGDFISKEEFEKIEGGVDEKIWLENGLPADGLRKVVGRSLEDFVYTDMIDSRQVIDNLMGTHASTRGASSGNATATQDFLQKDQDTGRVDGYVRDSIELFAKKWFEAMYHMYLVYLTEDESIAIPENDDFETDNVIFSRDRVPLVQKKNGDLIIVPLLFKVKNGSTMPDDNVAKAVQAEKMKDTLAPIDFYKLMGMPNPRELYKNSLIHQTDPYQFFKDDPDIQEMLQNQQAQAAAEAQAAAGGQLPPGVAGEAGAAQAGGLPPESQGGGEPTDKGVANAMVAILEEQGIDPSQVQNQGG